MGLSRSRRVRVFLRIVTRPTTILARCTYAKSALSHVPWGAYDAHAAAETIASARCQWVWCLRSEDNRRLSLSTYPRNHTLRWFRTHRHLSPNVSRTPLFNPVPPPPFLLVLLVRSNQPLRLCRNLFRVALACRFGVAATQSSPDLSTAHHSLQLTRRLGVDGRDVGLVRVELAAAVARHGPHDSGGELVRLEAHRDGLVVDGREALLQARLVAHARRR